MKSSTKVCALLIAAALGFIMLIGPGQGWLPGLESRVRKAARSISGKPPPPYVKPTQPIAYKKPEPQEFMRLRRNARGEPEALEVAIATYVPSSGADLRVDLVGAIHVADDEYFQALNRELAGYQRVLYELVAEKDTKPNPKALESDDPVALLQDLMPTMLGLGHQLQKVDYTPPHFVHADLSFKDLIAEGQKRGETKFTFFGGILLDVLKIAEKRQREAAASKQPDLGLIGALNLLSDANRLRKLMSEELVKAETEGGITGFTTLVPYVVEARNKAALTVLDKEIERGSKSIAIFYGAAHMPDFERRLYQDYGLERTDVRWLTAWDMTHPPAGAKNNLVTLMGILQRIMKR